MHTLSKGADGNYNVGYWLILGEAKEWFVLFRGLSFGTAIRAVNMMNGGEAMSGDWVKILERCT